MCCFAQACSPQIASKGFHCPLWSLVIGHWSLFFSLYSLSFILSALASELITINQKTPAVVTARA